MCKFWLYGQLLALVLHKVHPQILFSRQKMFVANFLPKVFTAFGKIIH
jgi:hypothetical protein